MRDWEALFKEITKHYKTAEYSAIVHVIFIPFVAESSFLIREHDESGVKYTIVAEPGIKGFFIHSHWIRQDTGKLETDSKGKVVQINYPEITLKLIKIIEDFYTPNSLRFIKEE